MEIATDAFTLATLLIFAGFIMSAAIHFITFTISGWKHFFLGN
ncbi:hypothetical protein Pan241w_22240 [Gimesia alba]|uniref:Uncharacterized protein n=1 Tax=Gimesia alba TaxID=2527973 RepID=A0A517RE53_9PLAN|nr:hypothetical protein Pan241w_22240 [Gimesia alba]